MALLIYVDNCSLYLLWQSLCYQTRQHFADELMKEQQYVVLDSYKIHALPSII